MSWVLLHVLTNIDTKNEVKVLLSPSDVPVVRWKPWNFMLWNLWQ